MTKASMIWLGALGLLIVGSTIDRYRTRREIADLRHEYGAAAEKSKPALGRDSAFATPTVFARVANATPEVVRPSTEPPSGRSSERHPESEADEAPSMSDQAAHIDAIFSEESSDQSWSREAESTITNALLPLAVDGGRIQQVACHSTLCKVRVEHTTEEGVRNLVERIFTTYGYWHGPMMVAPDSTGPTGLPAKVLYYAKAGHDLPMLDH